MISDPRPNQTDPDAVDLRFRTLFANAGNVGVYKTDPSGVRPGDIWLLEDGRLRACVSKGEVVTLAKGS